MHREVLEWLGWQFYDLPDGLRVFEIGSKAINGSARTAPRAGQIAAWWGCDLVSGPGVDFVGPGEDAAPPWPADVVVCCEVLEHTPVTGPILANAAARLASGGVVLVTCATDPRAPHSAADGAGLRQGEYYRNVGPAELRQAMERAGLTVEAEVVHAGRGDLYMRGRKP